MFASRGNFSSCSICTVCLAVVLALTAPGLSGQATLFQESFNSAGPKLDLSLWTTEIGPSSYLGRTQLADWVTPGGIGQFVVAGDGAHLALNTYNPTGFSLYGTHAKTLMSFQPGPNDTVVVTTRLRLASLPRGLVFSPYLYGCPTTVCATQHDEIDIELVANLLQPGMSPVFQVNSYANEPLGAGNGQLVPLPSNFDPLATHDWTIRWSLQKVEYLVDGVSLFSSTSHVPQGSMQVNMIAWAPASDWPAAYDAGLQPTATPAQNQQYTGLVTSVVVTRVSSASGGALSINNVYGGDFPVAQPWTLRLSGAAPNSGFAICATKDYGAAFCAPGFAATDATGNWILSGTFDASATGGWTEWLQFPSGATSNRVSFTVGQSIQGQFRLDGMIGGTYTVGQTWALSLSGAPPNSAFDICAEIGGTLTACTTSFGTTDSTGAWNTSGVFSASVVGGLTEWLRFNSGTTNRIAFTVGPAVAPPDDSTCASGTIHPTGSAAGFADFRRYQPDWAPSGASDYRINGNHVGGFGNTLEYLGCGAGNSVWLAWEYAGFKEFAVRAPWSGQTDLGLRIDDDLARFRMLYPAAHHPTAPYPGYYNWPADFDVWDVGPLRVVLQNGRVSMIQVSWGFSNETPGPDTKESTRTVIGPADSGIKWY